jgi:hypothetical protein
MCFTVWLHAEASKLACAYHKQKERLCKDTRRSPYKVLSLAIAVVYPLNGMTVCVLSS